MGKLIASIQNLLKGKKTYIVGILTIALGILQNDTQLIMTGITAMTLRAGVKKSSPATN